MRKEGKEAVSLVAGESDTAVSSSGLIMEARYFWMAWELKKSHLLIADQLACLQKVLRRSWGINASIRNLSRRRGEKNRRTIGANIAIGFELFQKYCSHLWSLPGREQERLPIKDELRTISLLWLVIGPTRFCQVLNLSIRLNPSQKLAVVTYFIKLIFILHRLAPRVAIKENARSLVARFVICQFINLKCSPFLKGLPPPVRGKVWRLALNNSLNLTTQLYSILRSAYSAYSAYSGEDNIVANMKRNEA